MNAHLCAESRRYCCNFCSFRASTPNLIARHRCAAQPADSSVALYRTVSTDMPLPTQASASASASQTHAAGVAADAIAAAAESDAESDSMQLVYISPSPAASPKKAAAETSPPAPAERSLFALTSVSLRHDDDSLSQENPFAGSPDAEHNSVSTPTHEPQQQCKSPEASLQCATCERFFPSQRSLALHQRFCEPAPAPAAAAAATNTSMALHFLCSLYEYTTSTCSACLTFENRGTR